MLESTPALDDALVKEYEQKITLSLDRQKESGQEFDKQIVYIAGGGLALTLTIAKDIVALAGKQHIYLLLLAWLSFAVALFLNLVSHRVATRLYDALASIHLHYRERYTAQKPIDLLKMQQESTKANAASSVLGRLNTFSLWGVAIGIFSFVIFTFINFSTMPDKPADDQPVIHLNKAMEPGLIKGLDAPSALFSTSPPPAPAVSEPAPVPAQQGPDQAASEK